MKTIAFTLTSLLSVILLSGCADDEMQDARSVFSVDPTAPKPESSGSRFGFRGDEPPGDAPPLSENPDMPVYVSPLDDEVDPTNPELANSEGGVPGDPANPLNGNVEGNNNSIEKPKLPKQSSVPYAEPIPGQNGYVYSPFAPGRPVEVTGFSPGQVVTCPYTQKKFKVP